MKSPRAAFTLIELLVVIAIIAVLSVVVVLSLNPAELLRQSRDANRLSDLSTLNSALALYTTDQAGVSGFSLGNASSVYVSLPDSSSTCGTWSLPALPSGYTYACVASTSSKNINNTGWIPVNFSNISGGAPFSNLPIDTTNQSSTGLYYVYYSNGSQYEVTAIPESQKQKTALGAKPIIQNYPEVLANGSSMTISPLWNTLGLIGYWNFDEGSGTTMNDLSGNGNNGAATGTTPYFTGQSKVGSFAGIFDGSTDSVNVTSSSMLNMSQYLTLDFWGMMNQNSVGTAPISKKYTETNVAGGYQLEWYPNNFQFYYADGSANHGGYIGSQTFNVGQWYNVAVTFSGGTVTSYLNGAYFGSWSSAGTIASSSQFLAIGMEGDGARKFQGILDDVRIYNRVLSPAEIQALYNAEK